ncbi:MAG: methyltransferase [Gemmatimonadetes bacterium]|nr:methyltransferase [Gemmatimonadota bacterium]
MPIENVSDTARWVAMYRAMETARPDALFRDPYAERLAGPKGREIVDGLKNGRRMAWPMIVRTAVLDEMILDRVRNAGVDTVINLAAGLDARAWRLDLPPALNWFDVDLPAITAYKQEIMRDEVPRCRYEAVAVDLTSGAARDEVLRRVAGVARSALVVTEGLLIYLTHEQVASLARALHVQASIRWWLSDIASPMLLKFMEKTWGDAARTGNAPFQFAIADRAGFFQPLGWREIAFRSGLDESRRLGREMPMAWLNNLMIALQPKRRREAIRAMNGYMLLERA